MKIAFYITNHGYGHASRNVAIIKLFLFRNPDTVIIVKSDPERCDFIRRNLEDDRVKYFSDCTEVGLILKKGTLDPDIETMRFAIEADVKRWPAYIEREVHFLRSEKPDLVIADIICWAIYSAKQCGIKSVLIGNFTWSSMYKSFYGTAVYKSYLDYYKMADISVWYEIHDKELESNNLNQCFFSLVSRPVNLENVKEINNSHSQPIIFVSLGASAEIKASIDVSFLPYDFITTRGITLKGSNVYHLPLDMINTQDYIAASEFVIAKGGWSTVAEILLQKKKCCLLRRGNNREDRATQEYLEERGHCIIIDAVDLIDIGLLIDRMKQMNPSPYNYYDSTEQICELIEGIAQ